MDEFRIVCPRRGGPLIVLSQVRRPLDHAIVLIVIDLARHGRVERAHGMERWDVCHQNVPSSILNAAGAFGFFTLIQLLTGRM